MTAEFSIAPSIGSTALAISFVALAIVAALAAGRSAPTGSAGERATAWIFGFFGIGNVPLHLALAVLLSSSGIAVLALDLVARLHLGAAYPAWFPAQAAATGLGVGLLTARLLAYSYPHGPAPAPPAAPYHGGQSPQPYM